ncbi:MAG: hypothetical protein KC414_04865, partial [Romboutsia sp.]|nr:hypothetical protein [Romboutsia sp.]
FLRMDNIEERTHSEAYGKIFRAMNNIAHKFSEVANFPIKYRVMLSVLDDFRLVGDKFVTFNTYKKMSVNNGKTKEEIESAWKEYRKDSFYNILDTSSGRVTYRKDVLDKFGKEDLDNKRLFIENKSIKANSEVDSVIPSTDQIVAKRDYLLNFMTAHRGYLTLAIDKRFKPKQLNLMSAQMEEGNYITLKNFIGGVYKGMSEKNIKNFIKTWKENYNKLDDYEKRNIRRTGIELATFFAVIALGAGVAAIADDDDNKDLWAVQAAAYLYFRTANEYISVQPPTGTYGLKDILETPFVAMGTIDNIMNQKDFSFEEVKSGAYEGHSRLYKKLAKLTWARHYYQLKNIKQTSDYYRLLQNETLFTMAR